MVQAPGAEGMRGRDSAGLQTITVIVTAAAAAARITPLFMDTCGSLARTDAEAETPVLWPPHAKS